MAIIPTGRRCLKLASDNVIAMNVQDLTVKDYILGISKGDLTKHDIIKFADVVADKTELLWDLWLADKTAASSGKPLISFDKEISKISQAIDQISNHYNLNIFGTAETAYSVGSFDRYINCQDKQRRARIKEVLHDLINDKRGNWVALVIRCGIDEALITRPSYEDLVDEFGLVIGNSNYKKYLSSTLVPNEKVAIEMNNIKKRLAGLLE